MEIKFSLIPIERTARSRLRGGLDDDDFDASLLPLEITEGVWIEDISSLVSDDEFEIYKQLLGTETVKHLERLKYVIIHRYTSPQHNSATNTLIFEPELMQQSQRLVQEIDACLRLIRPIRQYAQLCGGTVRDDGSLSHFHFQNPLPFFTSLVNQMFFTVRTRDIQDLHFYAPLFRNAMAGPFWKFKMAIDMFQSGFFQHTHWKVRYFLWTAALESLFTSQGGREHSGSVVAKERVKFLLRPGTPIYPPGELTSLDPVTTLTVAEVIDEIYCLRNHIAHGDKLPDYYYQSVGRTDCEGAAVPKVDMLLEALSSIVRQCLLTILKQNLLSHFEDAASSRSYFTANNLTKSQIEARLGRVNYRCPA